MSILFDNPPPAIGCGDPGDPIDFGLLTEGGYLSATPQSANYDGAVFTISVWVKRSQLAVKSGPYIILEAQPQPTEGSYIGFDGTTGQFLLGFVSGGVNVFEKKTIARFRDVAGWYHIYVALNTRQSGEADRVKFLINGIPSALTGTGPVENSGTHLGGQTVHTVGATDATAGANVLNGLLAHLIFCSGKVQDVAEFGYFNTDNVWVPKEYIGKGEGQTYYGANGFHLDFADPLDLGKDVSGNGNHFTATSLTVDNQVTDTPTNDFCVLNPLVPSSGSSLSSGNLRITSSGPGGTYGTLRVTRGVYKIEACFNTALDFSHIGWQDAANGRILGGTGMVNTYLRSDGDVFVDGVVVANVGQISAGSYIGVRLDLDAETVSYFRNGDPLSGPHAISTAEGWTPMVTVGPSSGVTIDVNFGQKPFVYDIDPDALAVCTANGACPAILNPDDYFTVRKVGDTTPLPWNPLIRKTLAVTKDRDGTTSWRVNDTVRGDGKAWACDVGGAEIDEGANGAAWTATGQVFGSAAEYQGNRITYYWRASPKAGFDIVEVNHVTGTPTVVPHLAGGLIDYAWLVPLDGGDCRVYHHALPAGAYYTLNSEPGSAVDTGWFSSTASALTIGAQMPSGRYVACVWRSVPQFSAFGVMPSNGAVDGPFWPMDFLPRVAMMRNYTTGGNTYDHFVFGHGENTNPATRYLMTNLPDTERQSAILDFDSNGIKVRTNTSTVNPAGSALIPYAAWAQTPGKFARAR